MAGLEDLRLATALLERKAALPRPIRVAFLDAVRKMDRRGILAGSLANIIAQPIQVGLANVFKNVKLLDLMKKGE